MLKVIKPILCLLAGITLSSCYCPIDKIHSTGQCEFRFTCIGAIRGLQLPNKCIEATNFPVTVHVNLVDAIERFDNNIDIDFLKTITNLVISANWETTSLSMLQYTTKLRTLNLANIGLENITSAPFSSLSRLEDLNLSHNKLNEIGELFHFDMYINKLRKLSLAHNAIEYLPEHTFIELISLIDLDLSYNMISDLTEEPFSNLTKLEILRLNNNRIKDLNGALNSLRSLRHLYLRGNNLQNVDDDSLKVIDHLQTFDLSKNELNKLKPILFSRHWDHFSNHSICKIILSENHISFVPNGPSNEYLSRFIRNSDKQSVELLTTELDLSVNTISTIEYNAFRSLIRVVSLNLSKNKIKEFNVNPSDLTYVQFLNLSDNQITHLYFESFSMMDNLQKLDLSYNKLDFIPDMTFNNNHNLKLVNMTYNDIEKLDGLHITMFHPNGSILDLSNNGLFKLKVPLGEGIRLVTLIIHSNNITTTSLIDLRHQTDLKILDMRKNFIQTLNVSSLFLPVSLRVLDLCHNRIRNIGPSTFYLLNHLETLRLGHNHLTNLEYGTFRNLYALKNLDLSYNNIRSLSSKLLMDLKSLQNLSLRSNGMEYLDYSSWYSHKYDLIVYVDNNLLSCNWLAKATSDHNIGYSKMRPTVLIGSRDLNSVESVPCVSKKSDAIIDVNSQYNMVDDRLLVTSQKILDTLREQNRLLIKFLLRATFEDSEKAKK